MKKKDFVYGVMFVSGLIIICGCDTETPGQLLSIIFLGFGLLCIGRIGLIKNNHTGGV